MIYLVTGGTGFIGAHLAHRLLAEGHEVVAFDWRGEDNAVHQVLTPEEISRLNIVPGDATDFDHLLDVCRQTHAEHIVHLAALLGADVSADPPRTIRVNVESNANVFEVALRCGVQRVVWASSMAVFGPSRRYSDEFVPNDAPHWPFDLYGACKSLDEAVARHYLRAHGLDSIGLRFAVVYGPGRMRGGGQFTVELCNKPALGQPGVVGFGDETVNWLYVDDVARCIVLASQAPPTKTRFFNMRGDLRPMREAVDYVRRLLPEADITVLPGRMAMAMKLATSVLEDELGFRPEWTLEAGLRATINAVRASAGLPLVG